MIYVTGDTHGSIDIRKFLDNDVTRKITAQDYVIICGDFGLIWNYKREIRKERKWLNWLNRRPWTTLFVDGNHECFPRLYAYPEKEWNGGRVHVIRDKIMHLERGEIYEIEGNRIFTMGGAASHDRGPNAGDTEIVRGKFWWDEEMISEEQMQHGLDNLAKYDFKVDYIITHCLPTSIQEVVKHGEYLPDPATDYLEKIKDTVTYTHWYSGHYHYNIDVSEKISIVFSRIIPLGVTIMNSDTMIGVPKFRRGDAVMIRYEDEDLMGTIKYVYPWGPFLKHDMPYYDITLFDTDREPVQVKETQIIEKSLIL